MKAYGAAGDAVHDDTSAFQAAVNAAGPTMGCVVVPPVSAGGGYVITGRYRWYRYRLVWDNQKEKRN